MVAPPRAYQSQQNPTVSRPNLITVQIQDDSHKRAAAAAAVAAFAHPPPPQPPPRFATALPYEEQGHQPTFHWSGATNMPPPRPSTVLPPPRPITGPPPPSTPPGAMMQQRTCAEPQFPYYSQ
ncbi:hypothetical protein MRX96_051365 [Rhipicephalus microplus]